MRGGPNNKHISVHTHCWVMDKFLSLLLSAKETLTHMIMKAVGRIKSQILIKDFKFQLTFLINIAFLNFTDMWYKFSDAVLGGGGGDCRPPIAWGITHNGPVYSQIMVDQNTTFGVMGPVMTFQRFGGHCVVKKYFCLSLVTATRVLSQHLAEYW